jgi:5-formyltetrahydrofolate cyclo-ligase
MRALRAAIPPEHRRRLAGLVHERLLALPEVREAGSVLLFYSFGSEVETAPLVARLHAEGKRLLLPYLDQAGMEAAEVLPDDALEPSGYGPKEPGRRVAVDPASVDVVVAPGLAFDRRGYRLGYGGGHYDRYLRRMLRGALRAGIGFSEQLVERIPEEPTDEPVDVVVTEAEVIDLRERGGEGRSPPL